MLTARMLFQAGSLMLVTFFAFVSGAVFLSGVTCLGIRGDDHYANEMVRACFLNCAAVSVSGVLLILLMLVFCLTVLDNMSKHIFGFNSVFVGGRRHRNRHM